MFTERYIITPAKRIIIKRDVSIKRLIMNDKQKCLACPKSLRLINGRLVKFPTMQTRANKYKHVDGCSQKERF